MCLDSPQLNWGVSHQRTMSLGPFAFSSPDGAAAVLARLRAERARWRPGEARPEVRAVGDGLAVEVRDRRFRLWVTTHTNASSPVAEGEVADAGDGARVTGRVRLSRPSLVGTALWLAWAAYLAVSSRSVLFGLVVVVLAGLAGAWRLAAWDVGERADVLRAVVGDVAAGPGPGTLGRREPAAGAPDG